MIHLTLLNGLKLSTESVDTYRSPDPKMGDNLKAKAVVHTSAGWFDVEETVDEIEKMIK